MRSTKAIRVMLIGALAPKAPPCFADRDSWVEYLISADETSNEDGTSGPMTSQGATAVFNNEFDFCADCAYSPDEKKVLQAKCRPDHLKTQEASCKA